jgi:hypothetical protein
MARILRRLSVSDISSVDRGAGEGCRVVLTKRHNEEVRMSGSDKCPNCGFKLGGKLVADDEDDDTTEMGKHERYPLDVVRKAAKVSADSIIAEYREKMPGATEAEVMNAATSSQEFMKLFRDERDAALRSGGHL